MVQTVICLMGPTASGKTQLAVELVKQFPLEIVSVDSALVYKGMDIGTAKPTQDLLAIAPHHLIDIITPLQTYSAADFCHDAQKACNEIHSRGKIPLLVGGTMMYFNAFQHGLASLPAANLKIREKITKEGEDLGWDYVHSQLHQVDPISAHKIHSSDKQRTQRALEVYLLTGKPLSELIKVKANTSFAFQNILLIPQNRSWLHERIKTRLNIMIEQNFLEEVRSLLDQWQLNLNYPAMRTVGYRQAISYLEGKDDFQTFYEKSLAATRQLAKRQLTWINHWENGIVLDPENHDALLQLIVIIQKILNVNNIN